MMNKQAKTRLLNVRDGIGRKVMEYLGTFNLRNAKAKPEKDIDNDSKDKSSLFSWRSAVSNVDDIPAPKFSGGDQPKLIVSPLLSKRADSFMHKPIPEAISGWRDAVKSPIVSSAIVGSIPALIYMGVDKFVNPDSVGKNKNLEAYVTQAVEEDKRNNRPLKTADEYIKAAVEHNKNRRLKNTLGVWLALSALAHTTRIDSSDWSKLYKYSSALDKKASMLGIGPSVDFNTARHAVLSDPRMSDPLKASALNVLNFNPMPAMTSTDIVNSAIYSGETARTGMPIGRLIASSVADAAVGYGLGNLLNVGNPGRLAGLFGIGSALINAVSYNNNRY